MHGEFERLRSRRTLLAADEGDPVLFTAAGRERKQPLQVTDVGGNQEKGYYLVVRGPRDGKYTIREKPKKGGKLVLEKSNKRVTNLRFADVADSVEADYRTMRKEMLNRAYKMMASDDYDYSEFAAAASDAASAGVSELPDDDLRVILMAAPRNAGDTEAYAYSPHDSDRRSVAYALMMDELTERGSEYANGDLSSSLDSKSDVDSLVDKALVMAEDYVEAEAADDMDEAVEAAARTLCDRLTTSDHQAVIDFLPRPEQSVRDRLAFDVGELVPWGDRTSAYERAVAYLAAEAIEEKERREKARMKADERTTAFDRWIANHFGVEVDELFEEGFSVGTPPRAIQERLPVLADGGMPHTMLDEATKVHLRDVPVTAGDWRLLDAGLVTDGENRRMVWANLPEDRLCVMASTKDGNRNEWSVWSVNVESDTTNELYEGHSFNDAIDTVRDFITPDTGDPKIVATVGGQETLVTETINEEVLGERVLSQAGVGVGGLASAFQSVLPYGQRAGGLFKTVGLHVGQTAGGAAADVGGSFYRRYRLQVGEFLLATVGTALLHNGSKVLGGMRFTPVLEHDALGFESEYRKGAVIVDEQGNTPLQNMDVVEYDISGEHAGMYRLVDGKGREMWASPGETSSFTKIRKVVNPHDVHIGDGQTLAWGVGYDEVADFAAKFGKDLFATTLGDGDGMGQTYTPRQTGSGESPYQSQRQRERRRRERERNRNRGDRNRRSGGGGGGDSTGGYGEFLKSQGVSGSEVDKMGETLSKITSMNAEGLKNKLGVGMTPSEAADSMEPSDQKPMTADAIEGETADGNRTDQLRHPNREEDVEVRVSEEDAAPVEDDYETRRDRFREQQEEEATAFYNSRRPDEQADLADIHEEAESVRRFEGTETTEDFDFGAAIERTKQIQRDRKSKQEREREEMEEELDAFEQDWTESEGFFDEVLGEQEDPA